LASTFFSSDDFATIKSSKCDELDVELAEHIVAVEQISGSTNNKLALGGPYL
jgi:hypothetical protein